MTWLRETPGYPANCGSNGGIFKPQTYDRGRDGIERILQAEEQILQRVEEVLP